MTDKSSEWLRARQPEQIAERRLSILDAASSLLDEFGMEGTGINAIARQAGISKANIYRYFESREAILLQLLLDEHGAWMKNLNRRFKKLHDCQDVEPIISAIAATLAKRHRYCLLVGALASVLEQNVSADTIRSFKRELLALCEAVVTSLQQAHSGMTPEVSLRFLTILTMNASGIWPHCNPAPAAQEVLAEQEFANFRFDFKETVAICARGLLLQLLKE